MRYALLLPFLAAASLLTLGVPALADGEPSSEAVGLQPLEVIARAVARWQTRPRPAKLSYTVELDGTRKGGTYRRRFRVDYTAQSRDARVTEIAAEGDPPPFVDPEKQRVFPDDTFGFVPREKGLSAVGVSGGSYPYDVRRLSNETVDGRAAYHLQFAPKEAAEVNVLRDLWIDAETYDVRRIAAQQTEHVGPLSVPYIVSVSYAENGPYWLVHRIEGSGSMRTPLFSYASSATATIEDLRYEP